MPVAWESSRGQTVSELKKEFMETASSQRFQQPDEAENEDVQVLWKLTMLFACASLNF